MFDHYEMNTKQSKSTLPLDLCNLHWRYNLIHVVHPHGCPGGPGALEMRSRFKVLVYLSHTQLYPVEVQKPSTIEQLLFLNKNL